MAWSDSLAGEAVGPSQMEIAKTFGTSLERVYSAARARKIITSASDKAGRTARGKALIAFGEANRGQRLPLTRRQLAERFGMQADYMAQQLKPYGVIFLEREEISDPDILQLRSLVNLVRSRFYFIKADAEDVVQEAYLKYFLDNKPNGITLPKLTWGQVKRGLWSWLDKQRSRGETSLELPMNQLEAERKTNGLPTYHHRSVWAAA